MSQLTELIAEVVTKFGLELEVSLIRKPFIINGDTNIHRIKGFQSKKEIGGEGELYF